MNVYITVDTVSSAAHPIIRRAVDVERVTHLRLFSEHFCVSPWVTSCIWNRMIDHDCLPDKANLKHLLWTLFFMKVYATEFVLASACECDPVTYRKWVHLILEALNELEAYVVSQLIDPPCWFLAFFLSILLTTFFLSIN